MSVQPLGSPKFQAFDSNGNPLTGGLLYTYAAGTTTPLATYTDSTGSVANANPVVLDSSGYANVWMLAGTLYKFVLKDSGGNTQYTVDNFQAPAATSASVSTAAYEPGGRLTLTSGTPVTTSDVTGATTLYYVPYKSDQVPLYDGTNWALYSIGTGLSQQTIDVSKSPAIVAANQNYDLFVWNDSGTVRLSRGPLWSSSISRGAGVGTTALTQVNGRWVNANAITNGPGAQLGLYVGTVRSDGNSQINDSLALRHVWNTYNRVSRPMRVLETASSWTYTTAAWRQTRANTGNQIAMVLGLAEDAVEASAMSAAANSGASLATVTGIGLDSTTAPDAACVMATGLSNPPNGFPSAGSALWTGLPGLGYHYLAWLEYSTLATGTTTWWGVNAETQTGIRGMVRA